MSAPRWLTSAVLDQLARLDFDWSSRHVSMPQVLEVHYQNGVPRIVKVRDTLQPPVLCQIDLRVVIATTS